MSITVSSTPERIGLTETKVDSVVIYQRPAAAP